MLIQLLLLAAAASAGEAVFASKTFQKNQVVAVEVHTDSGRVAVIGKDAPVKVDALRPGGSDGKCELVVELQKGVLHAEARKPRGALKGCDAGFALTVPPRVIVEAYTGSGSINAENVRNGAKLRTGSGDVSFKGVSGKVYVFTGSGDVEGAAPAKLLDVQTGSGDVSLALSAPKAAISVVSGSGNIALKLVKGARASFTLSSASGKVSNAFDSSADGSLKITATTGSGNITVR